LQRLRIGVDAKNLLNDRRGIGRYARALLQRWLQAGARERDGVEIVLLMPHLFLGPVKRRLNRIFQRNDLIVKHRASASSLALDALWYPWNGMTWAAAVTSIATVHDVWPFASPSSNERTRLSEQTPFRTTAAQAKAILTDSEFSKNEIVKHLGVERERIHVVHLGVDLPAESAGTVLLDGADRYVLFVGENEPRKGATTLLAAMRALPDALRLSTGLVMVGKQLIAGRPQGRIDAVKDGADGCVLRFQPEQSVPMLMTGEVSDGRLAQLYANAAVFAFPSLYEGFGLPVLEAMANRVPVVASDASSVPEAGGDAAIYFPAGDEKVLSEQLTAVLSDKQLAQRLQIAGRQRAQQMSWDECAKRTLDVIARTVQLRG
jgi:glycosyltransferase involved in cell wall biosynthesis